MWEFENYTVYKETDALRFENDEGVIWGYVSLHDNREQLIADLDAGVDPIADGWEDGVGNTINVDGW